MWLVNEGAIVRKDLNAYFVHERSKEYIVIEDGCTCPDYEQNEDLCIHMIVVEIARSGD
ncbi:SWIM zinc finger family protein [Methanospirillum hungatei]|uniref:SWIM zinc finger family protein n=1 Tax=Methanospirillum hungatei TaxID=2203 RepID=UPI000A03E63E